VLAVIDDEDMRRGIKGIATCKRAATPWPRKCSTAAKDNCTSDTTREWKTSSAPWESCSIAWSCGTRSKSMKRYGRCARKAIRCATKTWPDLVRSSGNTLTCVAAIHFTGPNRVAAGVRCATPRLLMTLTMRSNPAVLKPRPRPPLSGW
jgi:hypothetical protein